MPQATRTPIVPVRAAQRGEAWSVPRMRQVLWFTSTARPAGTGPPWSSCSYTLKSTRKLAQQAPQARQGWRVVGMAQIVGLVLGQILFNESCAGQNLFLQLRITIVSMQTTMKTMDQGTITALQPLAAQRPSATGLDQWPLRTQARVTGMRPARDAQERALVLRLLEIGFLPGETVRVVARGGLGAGPIAVRVGQATFALRRGEAALVQVQA